MFVHQAPRTHEEDLHFLLSIVDPIFEDADTSCSTVAQPFRPMQTSKKSTTRNSLCTPQISAKPHELRARFALVFGLLDVLGKAQNQFGKAGLRSGKSEIFAAGCDCLHELRSKRVVAFVFGNIKLCESDY